MNETNRLLVFTIEDRRYALHLEAVERVVRAVEVTPLPDIPEIVAGIINVQGRIIPAINMRKRFLLKERDLYPSDCFIIAATPRRTFALTADAVHGVVECPAIEFVPAGEILPIMGPVEGVMTLADGVVLISDIDRLLSLEGEALDDMLPDLADLVVTTDEEMAEQGNDLH